MELPQFKIRCSAISNIMAEPKDAAAKLRGELGETAKTYCQDWLKEKMFGRRKQLESKFLEKGNACEELGFDLITLELKLGMVYKNTELFTNECLQGTPDLIEPILIDNKCSWSLDTFPMFDTEIPNKAYGLQLQGYMALTNKSEAKLCYTLINTPEHLINDEIRRKLWKDNEMDMSDNDKYIIFSKAVYDEKSFLALRHAYFPQSDLETFIEIPRNKRIKTFDIKRDEATIAKIYNQVQKCRKYINTLIENY